MSKHCLGRMQVPKCEEVMDLNGDLLGDLMVFRWVSQLVVCFLLLIKTPLQGVDWQTIKDLRSGG
jgi:hypothetical protein